MKELNIIAVAYDGCDLSCKYCFFDPTKKGKRMSDEVLERLIKESFLLTGVNKLWFFWHGGEPMMAGKKFYEKVIYFQNKYKTEDKIFNNSIQTNGTINKPELINYLLDNNFKFGISLDGPKDIHDKHRPYINGKSSFEDIFKTIDLLKKKNHKICLITVITKHSLHRGKEIYEFLTSFADSIRFKPMNFVGRGASQKDTLSITSDEYCDFLEDIFPLWENEERNKFIRPFDSVLRSLISGKPSCCTQLLSCTESFIHLMPNGEIYSCGSFAGNKNFYYGDINEGLQKALLSKNRSNILNLRTGVKECLDCEYMSVCNGGCLTSSYMNKGIAHKDYWCSSIKKRFDLVKNSLIKHIEVKTT